MFLPLLPTVPLRLRGQGPPRSYFLFDIKQTARRTYLLSAFAGMRSRRKNFCVQLGFGACTNKYRLAKWIARRIACWNIWYQQALLAASLESIYHSFLSIDFSCLLRNRLTWIKQTKVFFKESFQLFNNSLFLLISWTPAAKT